MRSAVILLLVATTSCTSLFGLDVPPNVDRDNDNHRDAEDNCPNAANPDQSDFDRDGAGDACDECVDGGADDLDADGIPDGCDGCVSNGSDEDGDGIPDNCDGCLESGQDVDGDGIDDACDACIGTGQDVDGDQIDDACDACINAYLDVDGDGIDDGCDSCISRGIDADADGLDDECDPCKLGPQHDEDGDMLMDACDNCPNVANPNQENTFDKDGPDQVGDACDIDNGTNSPVFDAFTMSDPSWYVQGANWSLQNDAMYFLGGDESFRLVPNTKGGTLLDIWASVKMDSGGTGGFRVLAASTLTQPSPVRFECNVQPGPSLGGPMGPAGRVTLRRSANIETVVDQDVFVSLSQPVVLRLVIDEGGFGARCLDANGTVLLSMLINDTGPWQPGIAADNVAGHFNYFFFTRR